MARNENPPIPRGQTWYNGATIDTNDLGAVQVEGKEWLFEDINPFTGILRTNHFVRCRLMRNVAAAAIAAKTVVTGKSAAGLNMSRFDGACKATAEDVVGVVDEYLVTACPVNDVCWVVVDGPTACLVDLAGGANNVLPIGTRVVALTAATSGATTAGRVAPQDLTGATSLLANQIQNCIGRAMTARTTANTTLDVLIDVGKF